MWTTPLVLSVLLSGYHVLGGEIQDVTTVYNVGHGKGYTKVYTPPPAQPDDIFSPSFGFKSGESCINEVTGRVHARTNALGLGLINEGNYSLDSNSAETYSIACGGTFDDSDSCLQWEFDNEETDKWDIMTDSGLPIHVGMANKIRNKITFKKYTYDKNTILFTHGKGSLRNENIYIVMDFPGDGFMALYYNCSFKRQISDSHPYNFDSITERDGYSSGAVGCHYRYNNYYNVRYSDYLTVNFQDDRQTAASGAKNYNTIFQVGHSHKSYFVNWNYRDEVGRDAKISYFSLASSSSNDKEVSLIPQVLKVPTGGMVSSFFTPQSHNLCLAILYRATPYDERVSTSPVFSNAGLEISILGLLHIDRHYQESINILKNGWNVGLVNVSLKNINPIRLGIKHDGTLKIRIARIASCSPEGEEVTELPSPVSVCRKDLKTRPWKSGESSLHYYTTTIEVFDPIKTLESTTNNCRNGGVLTSAGCACTPGFSGSNCEIGCGRNRFGQDCEGLCSFHSEACSGLLLCTQHTGCRCAPGYHGNGCTQACTPGYYGNDCSERCGHCLGNSTCDIYTGECSACEEGYLSPHCKTATVYYGSKPDLISPSYGTIVVSFDPNNYVTEDEGPQLYQIQYREKGQQWKVYTSKLILKSSDETEKLKNISEKIEGLKSGTTYQVRVLLVDAYFQKYDGDLVQVAEIVTKCDIPYSYDYKVTAVTNTSAIQFSWRYVTADENWCPLETFEVTWKEGWKSQRIITEDNIFTLSGLEPGLPIKFKVRAKTSGGFAPHSKIMRPSAQQTELPAVKSLRVESSQSTSVELLWEPPRGSGDSQLMYTVTYRCVERPACSSGCQNVTEGQLTQESTSITLSSLLPFTKYLVTVSAEGGAQSSIFIATTRVVPTEVPVLSAQKPVRTNTSVTVFWDEVPVCSGYLLGYNYQLTKASDNLKILASGFTRDTNASFHNLMASTEYVAKVFVSTVAGWNPMAYLEISINTSATVPEAVRNLTVYKKGRGMLGLRWAEPRATYGQLKSFTVTHSLGQDTVTHTVEPSRCVAWPDLYCHTIEGLKSNRRYNVSVSARNSEVPEDGALSFVSAVTKEGPPSAPVNLKVSDSTSTSIKLQWNYPDMANGVLRSFLISVEETEKLDQDNCCQIYPFVETSVKEESQSYNSEVSGLHPASTYFVSVSGKTVGLGPSQTLVVSTRPPHLPVTFLPRIQEFEVTWLPQEKLSEVNNSDIYSSLARAHLLLAVFNESQLIPEISESGITDPKLDSLLQQEIGKPFLFITEYNQDDDVDLSGLEDSDSAWGRRPASLSFPSGFQLVATQVLEYNGVYNVDLRYSQPLDSALD